MRGLQPKLFFALTTLILIGCATSPRWDFDPSVNFYRLRSYDWYMPKGQERESLQVYDSLTHSRIMNAIEDEFFSKGYIKQLDATPDFLVTYHAATQGKLASSAIDRHYGYDAPSQWGYRIRPPDYRGAGGQSYEEGVIVIDIIDPQTLNLIWRGSSPAQINRALDPNQKEEKIRQAVHKILMNFPPQ